MPHTNGRPSRKHWWRRDDIGVAPFVYYLCVLPPLPQRVSVIIIMIIIIIHAVVRVIRSVFSLRPDLVLSPLFTYSRESRGLLQPFTPLSGGRVYDYTERSEIRVTKTVGVIIYIYICA